VLQFRDSKEAFQDSSSEDELDTPGDDNADFLFGMTPASHQTAALHPGPSHILKLWQIYLANVNPLMKIIHRPTVHPIIVDATTDVEHVPRGPEALLFAIYTAAVLSMRDAECEVTFGESRSSLLARYRLGTRRSLTRAKLMGTSDLVVLQAFVIYLVSQIHIRLFRFQVWR